MEESSRHTRGHGAASTARYDGTQVQCLCRLVNGQRRMVALVLRRQELLSRVSKQKPPLSSAISLP